MIRYNIRSSTHSRTSSSACCSFRASARSWTSSAACRHNNANAHASNKKSNSHNMNNNDSNCNAPSTTNRAISDGGRWYYTCTHASGRPRHQRLLPAPCRSTCRAASGGPTCNCDHAQRQIVVSNTSNITDVPKYMFIYIYIYIYIERERERERE